MYIHTVPLFVFPETRKFCLVALGLRSLERLRLCFEVPYQQSSFERLFGGLPFNDCRKHAYISTSRKMQYCNCIISDVSTWTFPSSERTCPFNVCNSLGWLAAVSANYQLSEQEHIDAWAWHTTLPVLLRFSLPSFSAN